MKTAYRPSATSAFSRRLQIALCAAAMTLASTNASALTQPFTQYGKISDPPLVGSLLYREPGPAHYRWIGGMVRGSRSWTSADYDFPSGPAWTLHGTERVTFEVHMSVESDPGGAFPPYSSDPLEPACPGGGPAFLSIPRSLTVSNTDAETQVGTWQITQADMDVVKAEIDIRCPNSPQRAAYLKTLWSLSNSDLLSQMRAFLNREWPNIEQIIGPTAVDDAKALAHDDILDGAHELEGERDAAEQHIQNDMAEIDGIHLQCQMAGCGLCLGGAMCMIADDQLGELRDRIDRLEREIVRLREDKQRIEGELARIPQLQQEVDRLSWQTVGSGFAGALCGILARGATSLLFAAGSSLVAPQMMVINARAQSLCVFAFGMNMVISPGRNSAGAFFTSGFFMIAQGIIDGILALRWLAAECTAHPVACAPATAYVTATFVSAGVAWGAAFGALTAGAIARAVGWGG